MAIEQSDNEGSTGVGEWMSDVVKLSAVGTSAACLIFDLELEEFADRIRVYLIYKDINNTIQRASMFDSDVGKKGSFAKEQFGTFEFHLNNALEYQACVCIADALY